MKTKRYCQLKAIHKNESTFYIDWGFTRYGIGYGRPTFASGPHTNLHLTANKRSLSGHCAFARCHAIAVAAAFLRATAAWTIPRKVLNISSGLGARPMASQAAYCAAKSGMDHFTRCVAIEEALKPNGAKICSLAPGVIATDMQVQLRAADPALFPDIAMFTGMYDNGALATPAAAAASVLAFLERDDFGSNPVADIRD